MKALAAMVGLGALACGQGASDLADAEVDALLSAPASVQCVRVVAAGAVRTVIREVPTAGTTQRVRLTALPTGHVLFTATAHETSCAGPATWIADDLVADLAPGSPVPVTLVFRPEARLLLRVTFAGNAAAPADAACGIVAAEGAVRGIVHRIPLSSVSTLEWTLGGMPSGAVLLIADASAESCSPSAALVWSAAPRPVTLVAGAVTEAAADLRAR